MYVVTSKWYQTITSCTISDANVPPLLGNEHRTESLHIYTWNYVSTKLHATKLNENIQNEI